MDVETKFPARVLEGAHLRTDARYFGEDIAFGDHKIAFVAKHCKDEDVLDLPNPWYRRNTIKVALHTEVYNNPEHLYCICPRTLRQLVARHVM
jgi:hypothetical protein